jgi:hypothetical protein
MNKTLTEQEYQDAIYEYMKRRNNKLPGFCGKVILNYNSVDEIEGIIDFESNEYYGQLIFKPIEDFNTSDKVELIDFHKIMNNIYAQILDLFMRYKAEKIKELGCKIEYYTEKDREAIMSWDFNECELIYLYLKKNIKDNPNSKNYILGLISDLCPFCIKIGHTCKSCEYCEYGKNHGICDSDINRLPPQSPSDWEKIKLYLFQTQKINYLTVEFYESILNIAGESICPFIKKENKIKKIKEKSNNE